MFLFLFTKDLENTQQLIHPSIHQKILHLVLGHLQPTFPPIPLCFFLFISEKIKLKIYKKGLHMYNEMPLLQCTCLIYKLVIIYKFILKPFFDLMHTQHRQQLPEYRKWAYGMYTVIIWRYVMFLAQLKDHIVNISVKKQTNKILHHFHTKFLVWCHTTPYNVCMPWEKLTLLQGNNVTTGMCMEITENFVSVIILYNSRIIWRSEKISVWNILHMIIASRTGQNLDWNATSTVGM